MSENEKTGDIFDEASETILGLLILGAVFGFIVGIMSILSIIGLLSLFV